jgi:hypothetical protein
MTLLYESSAFWIMTAHGSAVASEFGRGVPLVSAEAIAMLR